MSSSMFGSLKPYAEARKHRESTVGRAESELASRCAAAIKMWVTGTDNHRGTTIGRVSLATSIERRAARSVVEELRGLGYGVEDQDDAIVICEPDHRTDGGGARHVIEFTRSINDSTHRAIIVGDDVHFERLDIDATGAEQWTPIPADGWAKRFVKACIESMSGAQP